MGVKVRIDNIPVINVRGNSKIQSASIVEVIRTVVIEGKGTPDDPMRSMVQYWDTRGSLIGERLLNDDRDLFNDWQ